MPVYSVVIPYYNRPQLLLRAVESVLAQDFRDIETIVVDDASKNPPPALPENVKLIQRQRNGGGSAARNDGIRAAQGQYIAFLDSDDYWRPSRLADAHAFISKTSRSAQAIFFEDVLVKKSQSLRVAHRNRLASGASISHHIVCRGLVQTSTLIAPRNSNLLFDDQLRLFQDLDYLIQAEKLGYRLQKLPSQNVIWDLVGDENRLSRREDAISAIRFLTKHGDHLPPAARDAFILQNVDYWRRSGASFPVFAAKVLFSDMDWRRKLRLMLR